MPRIEAIVVSRRSVALDDHEGLGLLGEENAQLHFADVCAVETFIGLIGQIRPPADAEPATTQQGYCWPTAILFSELGLNYRS